MSCVCQLSINEDDSDDNFCQKIATAHIGTAFREHRTSAAVCPAAGGWDFDFHG